MRKNQLIGKFQIYKKKIEYNKNVLRGNSIMKCPYCGFENKDDAIKCENCHALLVQDNSALVEGLPTAVAIGNAQGQMQPTLQPNIDMETPTVEEESEIKLVQEDPLKEEKPNYTQQFIEQREKERAQKAQETLASKPLGETAKPVSVSNEGLWGIFSYLFWPVTIVAYFMKKDSMSSVMKSHWNQSVTLHILSVIAGFLPVIRNPLSIALLLVRIFCAYYAYRGEEKNLPYISDFKYLR